MSKNTMQIIKNEDNTISIYTPYNKDFVAEIKAQIGGCRWNPTEKCWAAPESATEVVREIMRGVYGVCDTEDADAEKVDIKIKANHYHISERQGITFLGRQICTAYGRDTGAKAGEGVEFLEGSPESGGSAKNWETIIPEGAVVVMRGVSKSAAEKAMKSEHDGWELEIISGSEKIDTAALIAEKEALLKRLAEIEAILK